MYQQIKSIRVLDRMEYEQTIMAEILYYDF